MSTVSSTYTVNGMTCAHCATSVSEEVSRLDGVRAVTVDLPTGQVAVGSDTALDEAAVRAAVEEAGYELVGSGLPGA